MTSSYIIIHTGYCSKVYVFTHVFLRTTLWENYHYHHAKDGTEDWGHWEGHTAHRRLEPSLLMDFWLCAVLTSLIFLPQPPVPGASGSVGSHFHLKRVCWDVFDSWWGLNFVLSEIFCYISKPGESGSRTHHPNPYPDCKHKFEQDFKKLLTTPGRTS